MLASQAGSFGLARPLPKGKVAGIFLLVFVGVDALAVAIDVAGEVDLRQLAVFGNELMR